MIRDRGTKKWTSLFLPEHVTMLRQAWFDMDKTAKPILDEYEIAELEGKIHYAMEYGLEMTIEIWQDGFTESVTGMAHYIEPITNVIRFKDREEFNHRIDFKNITKINVID